MKCSLDLGRMMCIVIDDGDFTDFAFVLETTVCTAEIFQSGKDHFIVKTKKSSCCDRSKGIGYVVDARYFQRTDTDIRTIMKNVERRMSEFVISDIRSAVFSIVLKTVGDHFTWKIFGNHFVFWCVCVDDECAVGWKKLGKFTERMTDVINILKEIQMVGIHI